MAALLRAALCAMLLARATGVGASEFALAAGDTLSFSVLGRPDIARTVQIDVNGEVFLPAIGAVRVDGLSIEEVRTLVGERIRRAPVLIADPTNTSNRITLQPGDVVVDVEAYRPIYVSGSVRTPGEYPFRPGLTTRQALARAGGVSTLDESVDVRIVELAARRERFRSAIASTQERIARLRGDFTALSPDRAVAEEPSGVAAGHAGSQESDWVAARRTQRQALRAVRGDELLELDERLSVLERSERLLGEIVDLEEENLVRARALAERGVATTDRLNDARQDLAEASARRLDVADEILRVRIDQTQLESQNDVHDNEQKVALLEQIDDENARLLELARELDVLDAYLSSVGLPTNLAAPSAIVVSLHRGGTVKTGADGALLDERLLPGDVVEISSSDARTP